MVEEQGGFLTKPQGGGGVQSDKYCLVERSLLNHPGYTSGS